MFLVRYLSDRWGRMRTSDGTGEALSADFALQRAMAKFLLEFNGNRLFVVAE